ncbi:unnamed protein product, partial [Discosporangium mesarthrocarpum]
MSTIASSGASSAHIPPGQSTDFAHVGHHVERKYQGCLSHGLFSGPVRRRLDEDDPLFLAGNFQRAILSKMAVYALEQEEYNGEEIFTCSFGGCNAVFSSRSRSEVHYETSHRHRCSVCGMSYPTSRLLDMHLTELHDSYFLVQAEREPMYLCLVEGCGEVFWSPRERKSHLVVQHQFPQSSDFLSGRSRRLRSRRRGKGGSQGGKTNSGRKQALGGGLSGGGVSLDGLSLGGCGNGGGDSNGDRGGSGGGHGGIRLDLSPLPEEAMELDEGGGCDSDNNAADNRPRSRVYHGTVTTATTSHGPGAGPYGLKPFPGAKRG